MRNRMYGGVRGRKTKVGEKLLRFPPTRLSGMLFYIYFFAPKNCHVAILIGYLFDYECIMGMAILCSSVLSAIYCHKNSEI